VIATNTISPEVPLKWCEEEDDWRQTEELTTRYDLYTIEEIPIICFIKVERNAAYG
jgi:hypothetical protein